MDRKMLGIYLNDHLTALTAGVELSRRCLGSNEKGELGELLGDVVQELEAERATLLQVMDRLEIGRDRAKHVAGWTFEKFGRLKLNGRVFSYSPMSRVNELEGLQLIVQGNAGLWRSLAAALDTTTEYRDVALETRAINAEKLGDRIEAQRLAATTLAISG